MDDLEKRGQSGDMFGGITALFSGLAFAGLIYTLFVQKKELQFQRQELSLLVGEQKETKQHIKVQADQLSAQSDFIEQQIFENRFFQMLSAFSNFLENIEIDGNSGTDALEKLQHYVRPRTARQMRNHSEGSINPIKEYENNFLNYRNDLAPYFRQIYTILKFVDSSNVKQKKFYTNILRARLCSAELSLLCLNCASQHGSAKMAPLVDKFDILKHFDDYELFGNKKHNDNLEEFYQKWDFFEKQDKLNSIE
ncbi:hypothetical protein NBRC116601_01280 [Cognatishimia sp. WU-CL00825]